MSSMWRQVVILVKLCWIWSEVSADVTLRWNDARRYCEDEGKVLFNAMQNESEVSLRKLLKNTNETWVSARVEFSHFVKVPVCMKTSNHIGHKKSFDTYIIDNCLKFCSCRLYAALKDRDCYCFNDSSKLIRSMSCNSTCNNDPFHQCGGKESISVYEKVDESITKKIVHGCKECVYARPTRGDLKLFAESCVGHVADSAICEAVTSTACRKIKWTFVSDNLCQVKGVDSLRWKQANKYCADIGGNLMSSSIPKINTMIENSTYWFGFYRIPMIYKVNALDLDTNDTCCAVARIEGDIVLIEGDDCRANHSFICQDESLERSSASPQSTEKYIPRVPSDSETSDRKIIYGVVSVFAVLLVAFVITALVCVIKRRQVSQECASGSATHSTREQHAFLEKRITNHPSKPSRKTHTKKENCQSLYENVRGRQDVAIQQPGYSNFEYDNINLDKAHIQETDYKDGDNHLYDHGSLHRTEEQYDVMNMSGVMTPIMDETYDRTTLSQS